MHVDGLVVVSEPSMRSFQTASEVGRMASELGLDNQVMVINRYLGGETPKLDNLPDNLFTMPQLSGLVERQMSDGNVLNLPESVEIDAIMEKIVSTLQEMTTV